MQSSAKIIDRYPSITKILIGSDATRSEKILSWIGSILGVVFYLYFYLNNSFNWSNLQYLIAIFIAIDVVGGAIANSLNSCKQFYQYLAKSSEPIYLQLLKNKLLFSAIHIHPLIVGLLFGNNDWLYGLFWYFALQIAVLITIKTPLYLSRPIAILTVAIAILINYYAIKPIPGFEWFVPLLFIKIVLGHSVIEKAYRPMEESRL